MGGWSGTGVAETSGPAGDSLWRRRGCARLTPKDGSDGYLVEIALKHLE